MSDEEKQPMGKRSLLVVLALSATLVILGSVGSLVFGWWRTPAKRETNPLPVAAGPAVRAYFGDLHDGGKLDRWTIVRIYDVHFGGIPVVLATADGKRFQVDLLRHENNGPQGVAGTTQLGLYIANQGDGGLTTPEEQGLGIMALAAALTARENAGAKPPPLLTITERLSQFSKRQFAVPID
jgi:hypothetical protein